MWVRDATEFGFIAYLSRCFPSSVMLHLPSGRQSVNILGGILHVIAVHHLSILHLENKQRQDLDFVAENPVKAQDLVGQKQMATDFSGQANS